MSEFWDTLVTLMFVLLIFALVAMLFVVKHNAEVSYHECIVSVGKQLCDDAVRRWDIFGVTR